jgi:methionine-rich copper-binding protein CopC
MRTSKTLVLAASLFALMAGGLVNASAHSFPEAQSPAAGETLEAPPGQITIKYDAPIEKLFASLQVLDAAGKDETVGAPEISSDQSTLSVKVNSLKPGDYTVKWRVVCVDTHHTQGSYTFTVTGTKS